MRWCLYIKMPTEIESYWFSFHYVYSMLNNWFISISFYLVIIKHYIDIIMSATASQITSLMIVYSTVYLGVDQRKHQSSASLAFVRGIHQSPVNSPHKWPVMRKIFPFNDIIMKSPHWFPIFHFTVTCCSITITITKTTYVHSRLPTLPYGLCHIELFPWSISSCITMGPPGYRWITETQQLWDCY